MKILQMFRNVTIDPILETGNITNTYFLAFLSDRITTKLEYKINYHTTLFVD